MLSTFFQCVCGRKVDGNSFEKRDKKRKVKRKKGRDKARTGEEKDRIKWKKKRRVARKVRIEFIFAD